MTDTIRLDRLDRAPAALLAIGPRDIERVLANPTLISLAGRGDPLFLCVMLHGNETTGFHVLQELVRRYGGAEWPRSALIFIGNVRAATANARFLDGQPDFNRIWHADAGAYSDLAREVMNAACHASVFASIDIHNNTGANPHYGCVNSLRPADLHLAAMFAPIAVFYRNPSTTQSMAFSRFCPALTIECGMSGDAVGLAHALRLVESVMRIDGFPGHAPPQSVLKLFETVGRVLVDPASSFSFGEPPADLVLRRDLEDMNFVEQPAGTLWANGLDGQRALHVVNEHGDDLTAEFFAFDAGTVRLKRTVTPAMITHNRVSVRQDCLCYLMTPKDR